MAYASASHVAAFCQNLLSPESTFMASTSPTLTEVNLWLSSGCAIIETKIAGMGYVTPVPGNSTIYSWVQQLNAYYAVAQAEYSRTNVVIAAGERTRGQQFDKMFWDGLGQLERLELSSAGLENDSGGGYLYGGGISQSDKDVDAQNTDKVQPRFRRGQFATPGTLRPDDTVSASEV